MNVGKNIIVCQWSFDNSVFN